MNYKKEKYRGYDLFIYEDSSVEIEDPNNEWDNGIVEVDDIEEAKQFVDEECYGEC